MDNIFISVNLLWAAYAEKKSKTMVHGFFRQRGHGLPNFFVQEYYKKGEKADIMRREANSSVLEGGIECPKIFALSVYDTKPVHFLSMEAERLVCNINEK